jgi:bifunctional UDP-N-acetylglucosamine pyrophosphorylase/glucosamine-1-phosphate N-acetyltransferase
MADIAAVVLAAGKGTRMKSELVKVMHLLAGRPLIDWPVTAALEAGATRRVLVVGHQGETVRQYYQGNGQVVFAAQDQQLGTGHAVACAIPALLGFDGMVLVLCGDVPLITPATLKALINHHTEKHAVISVLTTLLPNPYGYGRIIKSKDGQIQRIVEEKDASVEERQICEVNSGIYCIESEFLRVAIANLKNDNAQREYYLTDIVRDASEMGLLCEALIVNDPTEIMGVNDRMQLAEAGRVLRSRINKELMLSGVTMIDPLTTYIDSDVTIGSDTIIHPNVQISGPCEIGCNCELQTSVVIRSCNIGNDVVIKAGSVLEESRIADQVSVGPMAHLRPGTELMAQVKIGNFVETKKITMGKGSKASHLTYLGDAEIGADVNIGCGTITCNYDGVRKHRTIIGDGVFVGSDVQLVAPVTVGHNSLIAAGTTVTKDVPPDSLAIARAPQVNKVGWKLKKK